VTTAIEPHHLSAGAAARLIAGGELTAEALVGDCLERIAQREQVVRAWAHLDPEAALAQARERDREAPRGPLHGVPVGVKDIIDTADLPTEYGTPIHAGHRPGRDAACVAALRAAGAVVLGKTATTELATYHPSPTRNPVDPQRTPGGSSSGSAAAVADAMVPLALGSQTAGSVVRPAAFCGVLGLKPTRGLLDTAGTLPLSARLDTLGVFAREVGDLELALAALAGVPPGEVAVSAPPAVAFARTPWWDRADRDGRAAVEWAAARLADAGARVREVDLPPSYAPLPEVHDTLMAHDVAQSLAAEAEGHADQLSDILRAYIERGRGVPGQTAEEAVRLGVRCRDELAHLLAADEVLLVPAVVGQAPPLREETTGDPLFCRPWTLLGVPAVAVPGPRGPDGAPIGVQLVAPAGAERSLLAATAWAAPRLA
jgi:Asp-tRNA(Asn)/Glu-tRNA(Gln) amidotransferase A subunit family amidase